jgi:hypothetical protein
MKKRFIILILVITCFFVSNGFAQFQIGPLVGANLSGLSIEPDSLFTGNVNTKVGLIAGVSIVYNFSSMFSLQIEPAYMEKGAVIYTPYTDVATIVEIEQTIDVNYIDIPILLKVSFGEEFIKPYILAGGYIAFPLDDGKTTLEYIIGNGQDITELLPEETLNLFKPELITNSVDLGLNFGAGFSLPLGIIDIFLEAQYSLGLTNITDEEFFLFPQLLNPDIKNKGFQIKAGLLFSL